MPREDLRLGTGQEGESIGETEVRDAMGEVLARRGSARRFGDVLMTHDVLVDILGGTSAATLFLLSDLAQALDRFGPRGYRATQLEAGIVGGKIYLGALRTPVRRDRPYLLRRRGRASLRPDAAGKSCMLVVAVGDSPRLHRRLPR